MWMDQGAVNPSEEAIIRGGKYAGLEQGPLTTGHVLYLDSEDYGQNLMLAYHHSPPVRSSQPVEPWGSEMQGSGFGGGQAFLGREQPEKEVGVVSTCLSRNVGDCKCSSNLTKDA